MHKLLNEIAKAFQHVSKKHSKAPKPKEGSPEEERDESPEFEMSEDFPKSEPKPKGKSK